MHIANRHVERWAPESNASRVRSMRSLGFVDRLVSPWLETAQRSMGLRMFSSPTHARTNDRETNRVSWVFPRPWYQDELDWMAAAREVSTETMETDAQPSMLTTRGTYVAPQAQLRRPTATVMPSALYEYVAPSLSLAQPAPSAASPASDGGMYAPPITQAYSPLVSLAAVQAAELMNRAVAPLVAAPTAPMTMSASAIAPAMATAPTMGRITPALRTVLTTMLERAAVPTTTAQVSLRAPEMVTPPSPRADDDRPKATETEPTPSMTMADQVATDLHAQRMQMAQVHAIAQQQQAAVRAVEAQRVETQRVETQRVEAQRVEAQRVEAEVRQRTEQRVAPTTVAPTMPAPSASTSAPTPVPVPSTSDTPVATPVATPAEVERARLEERVLARVAEKVAAQRLHESARAEAAVHARSLEERREAPAPVAAPIEPPAEILAAIASLPPQLAGVVSQNVYQQLQQPGGALRAITQVNEALRTAELIARGAASNTAFEPTRGPRVVMPAGLGGLVATVDRAHGPTMRTMPTAPAMATDTTRPSQERYRVPTLPWIAPSAPSALGATAAMPAALAPTSALGAATTSSPQALTHVAWADRWLARFAGASPRSLDAIQAASSSTGASTMAHLASIAPQAVFLASMFDSERVPSDVPAIGSAIDPTAPSAMPRASVPSAPMPRLIPPPPPPVQRFDDSAETPDDVFAAISASASRTRKAPAATQPVAATTPMPAPIERTTYADHIAHAVPSAPNAGLSAQLASSPFAPALRHVLALPSAPSFDVRSLFGGSLSTTFLAGLLAPASHEVSVASPLPAWAQWSPALGDAPAIGERVAPSFDAAYVAPDASPDVSPDATATVDASVGRTDADAPSITTPAAASTNLAPLTTLRSALLSWTGDVGAGVAPSVAAPPTVETIASQQMAAPSPARAMVESMSMPMIGETEPTTIGGWTSPGAIADRAFGYSLAHERSTADLSFDFVPPELVLAARVYGLGPAEAAQAARLALAGPGHLTAMASTVDRTFVNAMAIEAERRDARTGAITTAFPSTTGELVTNLGPAARPMVAPAVASAPSASMAPSSTEPSLIGSATHTTFGVDRRAPRGAFLWPSATVAALGLTASAPDGEQSMSVAALELLAAHAVAEIGTYAALDESPMPSMTKAPLASDEALVADAAQPARPSTAAAAARTEVTRESGEPGETDVLEAAGAMIAPARRARFDALYVALAQSPTGRGMSPAARAARALALAGRGDDAPVSAYERAATVWDVLPVVYATEGMSTEEAVYTQAELGANTPRGIAARASLKRPGLGGIGNELVLPETRPGLSPLASRAGEALGGYVTSVNVPSTPVGATSTLSSSAPEFVPVAQRGPTAAQEMVQTGRPSGRHGGGETEIPPWFEAAARKMLGERMGTEGISMAELTLVNAAPPTQIAAASRTGHVSAAPTAPVSGGSDAGESKKGDDGDVDAIAEEVYSKILIMIDAARSRNGEPYL